MYKRFLVCLMAGLLLFSLVSCDGGSAISDPLKSAGTTPTTSDPREVDFTQGKAVRVTYNSIPADCFDIFGQVVTSRKQLDDMGITLSPLYGNKGESKAALAEYTVSYFEDKALVVLYFRLPSGSYRIQTDRALLENGNLTVDYTLLKPRKCTNDMADWYVLLEVSQTDARSIQTVVKGQQEENTVPSGQNS